MFRVHALRSDSSAERSSFQAPIFHERCWSVQGRNRLLASDHTAEFRPHGASPFRSHLGGLDVGGIRITSVRDQGAVHQHVGWHEDALSVMFFWGPGATIERVRHDSPRLVILGPGTEMTTEQQEGPCRKLRIGIRGAALLALRAEPVTALHLEPWLRRGIFRPRVDPTKEWRLQDSIVRSTTFVERALERGVNVREPALACITEEVSGRLLEILGDLLGAKPPSKMLPGSRRRLVEAALEVIEAADDEPASIAGICRRLGVSERTLQRAFQEHLGAGLRAYERERRLRGVHGAILAEGDRRTITDIAMSFGFWHLGRFAGAYKALFGCSPTETRCQVWDQSRLVDLAEDGWTRAREPSDGSPRGRVMG